LRKKNYMRKWRLFEKRKTFWKKNYIKNWRLIEKSKTFEKKIISEIGGYLKKNNLKKKIISEIGGYLKKNNLKKKLYQKLEAIWKIEILHLMFNILNLFYFIRMNMTEPWFPTSYVMIFFVFSELSLKGERW
jgi:hypothetical protein